MKTFNGKNPIKNAFATIIGLGGIILLAVTWLYHVAAQLVMMPRHTWLDPADRSTWVIDDNYPNAICYYYCNFEATMINQLNLMRVEYDDDYCHIDNIS